MSFGTRLARLATDAVVRWPRSWPLFRRPLVRAFDSIAPSWDAMRTPDSFAPLHAALASIEHPVRDALDVGTGTGEGALAILERFPDPNVVGVDVSPKMLERARAKAPEVRFELADAASLPFDGASFDLDVHANMFPFFDEVARVLRSAGSTVFAFSIGPDTPIHVPPERLRAELESRGFTDFAEFAAGRGTAFVARKR